MHDHIPGLHNQYACFPSGGPWGYMPQAAFIGIARRKVHVPAFGSIRNMSPSIPGQKPLPQT